MKLPLVIRFLLFVILPLFLITYLVVAFTAADKFVDKKEEINFWDKKGNYLKAAVTALEMISDDRYNLDNHYIFLSEYARLSRREKTKLSAKIEDVFGDMTGFYKKLSISKDTLKKQIGVYGTVKLRSLNTIGESARNEFTDSLNYLDVNFKYFNELKGDIYLEYSARDAARFYEDELQLNPSNTAAKEKLFMIAFWNNNNDLIQELLLDPDILNNQNLYYEIRIYHFNTSTTGWLGSIINQYFYYNDMVVIFNALIIFLVWFIFLFYINVFRDINLSILLLSLCLSLLSTPFVITLYDLFYFNQPEDFYTNIFLQNMITGLFEEFSKSLIPLLISLFLISKLKSPFSVLILFTVSALGFATLENMVYFGNYFDLSIVSVRAVYSVSIHMCATTLVGYGLIQFLYRDKSFVYCIIYFIYAVLLHAVYDLLAESPLGILNAALVVMSIFIMVSLFNNTLNNSEKFDHSKEQKLNHSGIILMTGLSIVMLIEFISNSFVYDFNIGLTALTESAISYGWLILVFASPLSNFKLVKEKWSFIDLGGMKLNDNFSFNIKKIKITPLSNNNFTEDKSTLSLEIIGEVRADSEKKWFHCIDRRYGQYYLVSFKEAGDYFVDEKVVVLVLKADEVVPHAFKTKSYPYLGLFFSSPVFE